MTDKKNDIKDDLDIVLDDFKNGVTDEEQALNDILAVLENHDRGVESHSIVDDQRRERVWESTNRILEYAQQDGKEPFSRVEEEVDTILSTVGVPDRIIDQ